MDQTGEGIFEQEINLDFDSEWNGRLDNGTLIHPGIYFVELNKDNEILGTGTMTIIK